MQFTYLSYVLTAETNLGAYAVKTRDVEYLDATRVDTTDDNLLSTAGFRTPFQLDRDRIHVSPYFPLLGRKTQVFIRPTKAAFTTRMTHTLQVASVGRTIGRALRLNEDLIEAIALGHDLGHAPFGHAGERVLNQLWNEKLLHTPGEADLFTSTEAKFAHGRQSVKILTSFQKELLTKQVTYGIATHSQSCNELEKQRRLSVPVAFWYDNNLRRCELDEKWSSFEAQTVRLADDIAWVCATLKDGMMAKIVEEADVISRLDSSTSLSSAPRIPSEVYIALLRRNPFTWFVNDAIKTNLDMLSQIEYVSWEDKPFLENTIKLSTIGEIALKELVRWIGDTVHRHYSVIRHDETARRHLGGLYDYFSNPRHLGQFIGELDNNPLTKPIGKPSPNNLEELLRSFCDYVSVCSDDDIVAKYKHYCVPDFSDMS